MNSNENKMKNNWKRKICSKIDKIRKQCICTRKNHTAAQSMLDVALLTFPVAKNRTTQEITTAKTPTKHAAA